MGKGVRLRRPPLRTAGQARQRRGQLRYTVEEMAGTLPEVRLFCACACTLYWCDGSDHRPRPMSDVRPRVGLGCGLVLV